MKKGLLIVNIGTPDEPTTEAVGAYLKEFLNDPLVIQMPSLMRHLLVNGIIVPQRASKSALRYKKVWTAEGSPLMVHLKTLEQKLQIELGDEYQVFAAMRYGSLTLDKALQDIEQANIDELTVLPLYPHYAQSTTESTLNYISDLVKGKPSNFLKIIPPFYKETEYIKCVAATVKKYDWESFDHILISYHSLPVKQVHKTTPNYEQACYETSELIAKELNLNKENYSTAFQSRMTKRWLAPYTNDALKQLAEDGKQKVLVITPSFVADCLETLLEIGVEYKEEFLTWGGKDLQLVPCINANDDWVKAIAKIIS